MVELLINKIIINNMPNRDGTGPKGQGPRTGRGLGNCNNNANGGRGLGYRRGRLENR